MVKSWPPSALVEDEKISLAREYGSKQSDTESEDDKAPPGGRGPVDQYPIILEVGAAAECPKEKEEALEQPDSRISTPPPPPSHAGEERGTLFVPQPSFDGILKTDGKLPQRSASACPIDREPVQRGWPHVSRIYSDLGLGDSRSQATGQRGNHPPYISQPNTTGARVNSDRGLLPSLLHTDSGTRATPEGNRGRERSTQAPRLDRTSTAVYSSDSDSKPQRNRHRSRSRVRPRDIRAEHHHSADEPSLCRQERQQSPRRRSKSRVCAQENRAELHHVADEQHFGRRERRQSWHNRLDRSPPEIATPSVAAHRLPQSHSSAHGHITPPQTPSLARESPYSSAAEDSLSRRALDPSRPRLADGRYFRESPPPSAVEHGHKKQINDGGPTGQATSSGSIKRPSKPHLDLHDVRPADINKLHSPRYTRTPTIIEDELQRAFEENQMRLPKSKISHSSRPHSSRPSPLSSPPTSPPSVEHRSRDYFELRSPQTSSHKQHSQPSSIDESRIKPVGSLLNAAIGGLMSGKAMPGYPRSSPTSLDTPSTWGHSSLASTQQSRKPSPISGEPGLGHRNAFVPAREEMHPSHSSAQVSHHSSQASQPTSVASFGEQNTLYSLPHHVQSTRPIISRAGSYGDSHSGRAGGVVLHQDRPLSGNGSQLPRSPVNAPPAPRTHSSSSLSSPSFYDQARVRPSQRRTYSTASGAIVMPASSQHPYPPPSSQTHHTYSSSAGNGKSSPTSATRRDQSITLPKCPHSCPVWDIGKWYAMRGQQHFLICPTCMQADGGLVLRDHCVPNGSRAPVEGAVCALSKPWIRIAVARFLQGSPANVQVLDSLSQLPDQTLPCPGNNSDVRKWYHIRDPTTKMPLPNSDSCGACVRSAEILFPELRQQQLFERPADKLVQERRCMLSTTNKNFYMIASELEKLTGYIRKNDLRAKDIVKFGELIKSKSKYRECQKDTMLANPLWHFIPALPEFTICEECFEEVVWPLRDKPIARDVQKTLQPVPTHRPGVMVSGVSCHLYSDRMRQAFSHAVNSNDFAYLKRLALSRFLAEQRLQSTHKALMEDMAKGIDRRAEVDKTIADWKAVE